MAWTRRAAGCRIGPGPSLLSGSRVAVAGQWCPAAAFFYLVGGRHTGPASRKRFNSASPASSSPVGCGPRNVTWNGSRKYSRAPLSSSAPAALRLAILLMTGASSVRTRQGSPSRARLIIVVMCYPGEHGEFRCSLVLTIPCKSCAKKTTDSLPKNHRVWSREERPGCRRRVSAARLCLCERICVVSRLVRPGGRCAGRTHHLAGWRPGG